MRIEQPTENEMSDLLPSETLRRWKELVEKIESMYEVDQIWSKGFGEWIYEYKFRRGGQSRIYSVDE